MYRIANKRERVKDIILFVCDGNTCRSPMAETIFNRLVRGSVLSRYRAMSAGLSAEEGTGMSEKARGALEVLGYTADAGFLSRRVTPELLQKAYIIICMTEYQREQLFGYENAELFSDGEVPDPYGGSDEDYLRTAIMLQRGILELTDRLRASRII